MLYAGPVSDDRLLLSQLVFLRTRRDSAAIQLRQVDLEIGTTIGKLLWSEGPHTLSSIARELGVSHTHVKTLARRAQSANPDDRPEEVSSQQDWLPPILDGFHAAKYLEETKRHVVRVIASFVSSDILWMTGLSPTLFDQGPGRLELPHMIWELDDGSWLGIGPVNVGYGGTGGTLAFRALTRAGIDATLANRIVALRWSDTHVPTGEVHGAKTWPRVPLDPPESLGAFYVLNVNRDSLTNREQKSDETGFYPSHCAGSPFRWAIDYLDSAAYVYEDELPKWLHGPRRARVFLDKEAAYEQGFGERHHGCTLVIEQGALQLWIYAYPPRDQTQLLADEAYDALAYAGLYPENLAKLDARSRFWRHLDHHFGPRRPRYLDISPDGQSLQHAPGTNPASQTVPTASLSAP